MAANIVRSRSDITAGGTSATSKGETMPAVGRPTMRHHPALLLSLALILVALVTACSSPTSNDAGGGGEAATDDGSTENGGGDTGGDDAGGSSTASITVTISGGSPHDGTHEAEAPDAGCSRNLTGENTFGLQYSVSGTDGFNSHQLIIDDASGAASGSEDFVTDVTIDGATYGITSGTAVNNEPRGSGTVTLDDRGDTATITIEGETDEGYGLEATVECHQVAG